MHGKGKAQSSHDEKSLRKTCTGRSTNTNAQAHTHTHAYSSTLQISIFCQVYDRLHAKKDSDAMKNDSP